jgi:hypothetical protein
MLNNADASISRILIPNMGLFFIQKSGIKYAFTEMD